MKQIGCLISVWAFVAATGAWAGPVVIDFEALFPPGNPIDPAGVVVTNQFEGLSFENTTALVSSISLNEFDFPPHSGIAVALDLGGPMAISFNAFTVKSVSGFFTYLGSVQIDAFDSQGMALGSANSFLSGGNLGGSEEILLAKSGIASIVITGDSLGSSFTLDDFSYTTESVPEPASLILLGSGLTCIGFLKLIRNRKELTPP